MDLNPLYDKLQAQRAKEALPPPSAKTLERLQKALSEGATTGDAIRDHVIKHWKADPQVEDFLRRMQQDMSGKVGQLCLAVLTAECTHPRHGHSALLKLKMCVLTDDQLGFDDTYWVVRTNKLIGFTLSSDSTPKDVKTLLAPLNLEWKWVGHHLPPPLNRHYAEEHDHALRRFHFICGKAEIEKWFGEMMCESAYGIFFETWLAACEILVNGCDCPEDQRPHPKSPFDD